jgi:redox-sensitive bicupin YhaK (pirin superfamily)
MRTFRRAADRGFANHGWLKTFHTFSFANYYDPRFMGFRYLRVINEDVIAPSSGFDTHDHANMEILTWVIEGELTHEDSLGSRGVLGANEAQVMSAGTGISHSEYNHSAAVPVHLLQIWLEPRANEQEPVYAQKLFSRAERLGRPQVIASPDARDGSLRIGQDAVVSVMCLRAIDRVALSAPSRSYVWVQSISAEFRLNGERLAPGDGVAIEGEEQLVFEGSSIEGDVLMFEMI